MLAYTVQYWFIQYWFIQCSTGLYSAVLVYTVAYCINSSTMTNRRSLRDSMRVIQWDWIPTPSPQNILFLFHSFINNSDDTTKTPFTQRWYDRQHDGQLRPTNESAACPRLLDVRPSACPSLSVTPTTNHNHLRRWQSVWGDAVTNDRGDLDERRSHGQSVCLSVCLSVAMIMVSVIMVIRRVSGRSTLGI